MNNNLYSFKNLFLSYTFAGVPIFFLSGVLAVFKVAPVYFNEAPHYGWQAFLISIIEIPLFGLVLSMVNWILLNLGHWLRGVFSRSVKRNAS
jgi:hypothetical protein